MKGSLVGSLFRFSDPDYYVAMTPEPLRWAGRVAREAFPGGDFGAVPLGDASDPSGPLVGFKKMAPGEVLSRHAHDCVRVEVILDGYLELGDGSLLERGDITVRAPAEFYGPYTAGPEGCVSIEMFSKASGMTRLIEETATDENVAECLRILAVVERERART